MSLTEMIKNREVDIVDIGTRVYYAERCLQAFQEQYFGRRPEQFVQDEAAQSALINNYETIAAQLYLISDYLFETHVKLEFASACGSVIEKAHMINELGMMQMDKVLWSELASTVNELSGSPA